MVATNPVGRFRELILRGQNLNGEQTIYEGWCELLEVDKSNFSGFLHRFSYVLRLPAAMHRSLTAVDTPVDRDILFRWLPQVEKSFHSMNLMGGKWSFFMNHYTPETIYGLEFCADLLARKASEGLLDLDRLDELSRSIAALLGEVAEAELDPEVASFVTLQLRRIQSGIDGYILGGVEEFRRAVEAAVGATLVYRDPTQTLEREAPRIWTKFRLLLAGAVLAMHALNEGIQLAEGCRKLLGLEPGNLQIEDSQPASGDAKSSEQPES